MPIHQAKQKREKIPHDQIFKTLFRNFLADLVEIVDPKLARLLDLSQPKWLDKEAFTDLPGGRRADLDLVAEAPMRRGKPRVVLVHVENERRFRKSTARRLWRYALHLELKYGRPVITIVIFLEGGPAGVQWHEHMEKVGPYEIHRFRYLAFGLSGSQAEHYLELEPPLAAALAALMRSETLDRPERKLRCLKKISQAELDDARRYLLNNVVDTYIKLEGGEAERFAAEIQRETNQEVREMVITWEEALAAHKAEGRSEGKAEGRSEGKAEGRSEGRAEGRSEGKLEGLRVALLTLLRRRFGIRSGELDDRLQAIDNPKKLEKLLERAIDARSLDELGLAS